MQLHHVYLSIRAGITKDVGRNNICPGYGRWNHHQSHSPTAKHSKHQLPSPHPLIELTPNGQHKTFKPLGWLAICFESPRICTPLATSDHRRHPRPMQFLQKHTHTHIHTDCGETMGERSLKIAPSWPNRRWSGKWSDGAQPKIRSCVRAECKTANMGRPETMGAGS